MINDMVHIITKEFLLQQDAATILSWEEKDLGQSPE